MDTIKINVNKQLDGYSFSISPSIRQSIRQMFPDAHPANNIFVAYDIQSNFEDYYGKMEEYIYPVLLGIDNKEAIRKKINEILFIDTQSGKALHTFKTN